MIRIRMRVEFTLYHPVKLIEEHFHFLFGLAFDRCCHHRSRRLRDRAAGALKADVFDDIAIQLQIDRQLIAAERIVALLLSIRLLQHSEVPRLFVVVENDLLIEFA